MRISRKILLFVGLALVLGCSLGYGPPAVAQETPAGSAQPAGPPVPEVAARSWVLVDLPSGEYLAGENAEKELPMGSTDKIMVALVVLEAIESGEASLDEEVIVSEDAAAFAVPLYSNVGLFPGDALTVRELLMGALISSGNDAAWALAEHFGDGSVERFVERMNDQARELGLEDTSFRNPTGLDDPEQHSSARDLATMTRAALGHPFFREAVATTEAAITTADREIPLSSTNDLLFTYRFATGVKTGTTPAAGPCLVSSAADGDESYVAVVLDAEERFADSAAALGYGFDAYDRRTLVPEGRGYREAELPYRPEETVELVAAEAVGDLVKEGARVEREVEVVEELPGSAGAGERLGTVTVRVDGERVGESPLVARRGYEEASAWEKVWYTVGGIFGQGKEKVRGS